MLNAGLQPVREDDEVAPLNSYLRWLPRCYDPGKESAQVVHPTLCSLSTRRTCRRCGAALKGTGHPGITMLNRGGRPITSPPLNRLDRGS